MKTSVLFSSLATFCLLMAFAESGNHHSFNSNDPSVYQVKTSPANCATIINKKKESKPSQTQVIPIVPSSLNEDFHYLKFDVNDYLKNGTSSSYDLEVLPIMQEPDYSYLKFDVGKYTSDGTLNPDTQYELPVPETVSFPGADTL
jgi:hypothetical protein